VRNKIAVMAFVFAATQAGAQATTPRPTVSLTLNASGIETVDSLFIVNALRFGLTSDSLFEYEVRPPAQLPVDRAVNYLVSAITRLDGDVFSVSARVFNVGTATTATSGSTTSVGATLGDSVEALGRRLARSLTPGGNGAPPRTRR